MFWFPELGGWEPPQVVGNLKVPHLFGFTRLRGYVYVIVGSITPTLLQYRRIHVFTLQGKPALSIET